MATVFQLPKNLPSFPGEIPIFKTDTATTQVMEQRLIEEIIPSISVSIGLGNIKPVNEKSHFLIRSGPQYLKFFKASGAFLYTNEALIAGSVHQNLGTLPTPKKAFELSEAFIRNQGLLRNETPFGKLFQTFYEAFGYTAVQSAEVTNLDEEQSIVKNETEPLKTEIHTHFGYKLEGMPVFGPGAQTVVSYAGNVLSQEIHFWRPPLKKVFALEIIAPKTALNILSKHKNFVNVTKVSKDKKYQTIGRLYDDVQLGYYALTPCKSQRYYIPVYRIRGTFESRLKSQEKSTSNFKANLDDTFRYDFEHYVLALHGNAKGLGLNQFKHNIIW